jgi:hypothetical protein
MINKIHNTQINTLNIAKKYHKKNKNRSIDISVSPFCDFVTWADCIGNEKIKLLQKNRLISFQYFKNILKEIFLIGINSNYEIASSKIETKNIDNVIYSYCSKKNFNNNGEFYDTNFNYGSKKNSKTVWFLISQDNYIPKKIFNTFILYKKKNYFNLYYLFHSFLKNIFKKNFFHKFNYTYDYSKICYKFFFSKLQNAHFNLYIPYENRPHQNQIIRATKKISKKNKIYCYYQRAPEPLQLEMIYKEKNIDKLYVCSKIQKNIFIKYFSWPEKKIEIINSLKHLKFLNRSSHIFLPYNIENSKFFLERLEKLQHLKKRSFNNYKISIHPLNEKSKEHLHLKKMIKINLTKNKNKPNNVPIILGAPGGTASEMLDTVGKVYHICDNYLDIFSQKIWKNVKVTKISDSIYEYKKISYKFLLTNGNKNNFYNLINKNKNF